MWDGFTKVLYTQEGAAEIVWEPLLKVIQEIICFYLHKLSYLLIYHNLLTGHHCFNHRHTLPLEIEYYI